MLNRTAACPWLALWSLLLIAGVASPATSAPDATQQILLTSEHGPPLTVQENVAFHPGHADGPVIIIDPDHIKQEIYGIGTSFTESSAYVLAHLDPDARREVMRRIFGAEGADFTLARTHIGACDFSVAGKYSYAEHPGDTQLARFSIAPDTLGFDPVIHTGIRAPTYDLLPMIREALAVKRAEGGAPLRIVASAWTAPPWMKDIETWYIPGSAANNWQGTGGSLKPEFIPVYADYLIRYLDAYAAQGVPIWALTPVNEPHGNGGFWESMNFSPGSQKAFVLDQLGPKLRRAGHGDVNVLVFDQNRDGLEDWADVILGDPRSRGDVFGIAVHWYSSTFKVYADAFDRVHARFPRYAILHTEGCIDDLGKAAPGGIADPEGFQESGWFRNDAFWWHANATDWAYTASWAGPGAADHPAYVPVHRYARDIIVGLDHWLSGWIDWNIVLDSRGGPNHAGNDCGAPIMIDTTTGDVYYTPIFHVLAQFSRTIRPGDRAIGTRQELGDLADDSLHACATVNSRGLVSVQLLNTTPRPIDYKLQVRDRFAELSIPANAVQTVRLRLP